MGVPPSQIDILTSVSGVNFDDAWANRVEAEVEGIKVLVIGVRERPEQTGHWSSQRCDRRRLAREAQVALPIMHVTAAGYFLRISFRFICGECNGRKLGRGSSKNGSVFSRWAATLLSFSRTRSSSFFVALIPSGSLNRGPSYSMPQ
jgi:hypothetical protein